jgi:hypothetical protein
MLGEALWDLRAERIEHEAQRAALLLRGQNLQRREHVALVRAGHFHPAQGLHIADIPAHLLIEQDVHRAAQRPILSVLGDHALLEPRPEPLH